jgi:spermidine/putrescine transport system permease protein
MTADSAFDRGAQGRTAVRTRLRRLSARDLLYSQLFLPAFVMVAFAVLPVALIFVWSFWQFTDGGFVVTFTLEHYLTFIEEGRYQTIGYTLYLAILNVLIVVPLGYPVAYAIYRFFSEQNKMVVLMVLAVPFMVNRLLRIVSLSSLLSARGPLNQLLFFLEPQRYLLYSEVGIRIGFVFATMPIAIMAIWLSLERIDESLLEASYDLGGSRLFTFRKVVLPLSQPGIAAATLMIFVISMGSAAIPSKLGGPSAQTIGSMIERLFAVLKMPMAGVTATLTLVVIGVVLLVAQRYMDVLTIFKELE